MSLRTALGRPFTAVRSRLTTRRSRVVAGVLALLVVIVAVLGVGALAGDDAPSPVRSSEQRVEVAAGPGDPARIGIDTTLFTPPGAHERAPAVLLAHGFGGSKAELQRDAEALARSGYVVLTYSARGFGGSQGQIMLDQPDYEVADARALIDWLASRPEVRLDGPGDPRVGVAGASYGGALSLLAAAYDPRVDAIAPQLAWHDLADSLLPNAAGGGPAEGVFKKTWAGLFFSSGTSPLGTLTPVDASTGCGRFAERVCAVYREVATTGRSTPQAIELLRRGSPASVADRIAVPTLLVQGQNDSLFPLDQADRNAAAIARNGAPVEVLWTSGGHDGGKPQTAMVRDRVTAWFDRWLAPAQAPPKAGAPTAAGPFRVTRSGGVDSATREQVLRVAEARSYPGLTGSRRREVPLTGPEQTVANPPGGAPTSVSGLPGLGLLAGPGGLGALAAGAGDLGGIAFDLPGQSAFFQSDRFDRSTWITGSTTARVRVSGADDIVLFAKLYDVAPDGATVLPHQLAAPVRVSGAAAGRDIEIHLPAIDHELDAGHRLRLVLTSTDLGFASPNAPAGYRVALAGPLTVPSVPQLHVAASSYPWWTWGLPLLAVLIAAALLLTGRRRAAATAPDPALAEVPLQIRNLTKRYKGGKLAVDDLSFEVEAGQVLGLLGPNGAGKTTTLRMLMGLIHPDEGGIRIFGRTVGPGAPVLSRLGSFVEGPGFLPHLSGRENLSLYWRATGRPHADAHFDEALEIAGLGEALDRNVRTYSQGMRQRLAIAQAMLGLPDLLVLDEPTNGLDPPQIRAMRDVLIGYAATGRTVVVSSHLLAEVEQTCTHVVVMHRGRLIAAGPVAEIVGNGNTLVIGTPVPDLAIATLKNLAGVASVEPEEGGVLVHLAGAQASVLVAELVGAGVAVDRVTTRRRLEDAFLTLIGES
ncbi:alpha/beta fold hydrolase [Embleya sp. NBC_00896]|uniref:alpha/beta fold hydrolase n=1 Tax=Embleya sp. NBC_00896 TaxID=2975961 RepID=UPI003870E941|nr:alpha/beta fold hydrolase [Embleya sp. NBC_00896]